MNQSQPLSQHKMPDGAMMSGTSMKQHQQQACADCTPTHNPKMTAANKPSPHTHPDHGIYTQPK